MMLSNSILKLIDQLQHSTACAHVSEYIHICIYSRPTPGYEHLNQYSQFLTFPKGNDNKISRYYQQLTRDTTNTKIQNQFVTRRSYQAKNPNRRREKNNRITVYHTSCSKCPPPTSTHARSLLVKLSTALLLESRGNSS